MKPARILPFVLVLFALLGCDKESDSETREYLVARPLTLSLEDFRSDPVVIAPQPLETSGKIYAYGDYIFVNEPYKGVHVIDNTNPAAPRKARAPVWISSRT